MHKFFINFNDVVIIDLCQVQHFSRRKNPDCIIVEFLNGNTTTVNASSEQVIDQLWGGLRKQIKALGNER